ncbi:MAG: AAA family ATPase [Prevotella sp.]|nr:AAA family ATPase [Prevotella sp.]
MKRNLDLLSAVEQIVEKAKGSGLSSEFFRKADRYIKYVAEKLELTKEQSVMMALFIDYSDTTDITISMFSEFLGCRTTRIIRYMSDIDVLEKRELIRCSRDGNHITYRVPIEVIEAFKKNEKFTAKDCSGLSCQELFVEIEKIFELRDNNELTFSATADKIQHLFDCNAQLLYVQKVRSYKLDEEDEMMLVLFSHLFVNNSDDEIMLHDLEFLYDNKYTWRLTKTSMNNGTFILLQEKIIENNCSGGFVDRSSFRFTAKAKRDLFSELNLSLMNEEEKRNDVIKHEEITHKKLFYDENISRQIAELGKLLEESEYKKVHSRMKANGFKCGFTCLFYGAPGTGKTETVMQLARQTKRDILLVNVSQIKSMWVGESEKNIKQVFDAYRSIVKERSITPILLFNEADAIIGKRHTGAERAVDKMENAIQNIILQEMESLDGILIATTNLVQNMDKAFERRFLYKIKFEKPTVEARMNMWHEMIPALKDDEIRTLATKYNFSGGQVENIARHYTIANILHGESENIIEELSSYCDNERLDEKEHHKIGFNV